MDTSNEIGLGDVARDTITGFSGVVMCVSKWLYGCERLTLQPQEMRDGKPIDMQTFDRPQLELVTPRGAKGTSNTGGPRPEPQRGR